MSASQFLGKYEIRRQLGRGAMGTVYEGWDPVIKRRVAIKTVRLPATGDGETAYEISRFRREAEAAGRLNHPNIVSVFDYGETSDVAYIVMEYVDGPPLKALLDKNERFPLLQIVEIMEDLLGGLQYSHERGVVHRDVKPANLMLTTAGQTKIADFGIARIDSSSMTQAGTVLGTPAYMSPEQFMGQVVDARTDIYSSAVLLYQLLTGERPFDGSMTAIMHKALYTEAAPPSQVSVTVPRQFDAVIKRAMAKRPDDRFSSAKEFAAAIRASAAVPVPSPAAGRPDFSDDATIPARPGPRARTADAIAKSAAGPPPVPAAPVARASTVRTPSPPPRVSGAIAVSDTAFPWPGFIGAGVAGLALLGGVGYFLLSGSSTTQTLPHRPDVQVVVSATAPAPPATSAHPDPGQAAASSEPVNEVLKDSPASAVAPVEVLARPPAAEPAPTVAPPAEASLPPYRPSPLDQTIAAARSVPCSALSVASQPDGLHIGGFARPGPELDRLRVQGREAGPLVDDVTETEPFACGPITAVAAIRLHAQNGVPGIAVKPDPPEPISGQRFAIDVNTTLPAVYVDLYQNDGSVRHLMRPQSSNGHAIPIIAPAAGPGLIVAIGAAKRLDLGVRPDTEPADVYLTALQSQAGTAALAADLVMMTVRPAEPVARPIEPAVAKPVAPPVPRPRPAEPAVAKAPPPHAPSLHSARCSNIVSRAQLGETLSDGELTALRTECRS